MAIGTEPRNQRRPIMIGVVGLAGVLTILMVIILAWDLYQKRSDCILCSDGQHCRIDMRDFVATYSAYSIQLEAGVGRQKDFAGRLRLDPVQLKQVSDSLQHANEFRKYLVAGYNSCAISAAAYERDGRLFQAMDNVAREINHLAGSFSGEPLEHDHLTRLISQFNHLAKQLGGS